MNKIVELFLWFLLTLNNRNYQSFHSKYQHKIIRHTFGETILEFLRISHNSEVYPPSKPWLSNQP